MNKINLLFYVVILTHLIPITVFGQSKVVINEIMVNPNNSNLPNFEYIELFNNGTNAVHLDELTLSINNNSIILPKYTLPPQQFVVLSSMEGATAFQQYGNSLALSPWYALNNTSATITLKKENNTLDFVAYNNTWYNNTNKRNGGWSLERINPSISCNISTNWSATMAPNGGTPSKPNSILNKNSKPVIAILSTKLIGDEIHLTFNVEQSLLTNFVRENFSLDNIGAPSHIYWNSTLDTLILQFDTKIESNNLYLLQISDIEICGTSIKIKDYPIFEQGALKYNSIVINEILFNPKEGGVDFVELYNQELFPINLKNWKIGNRVITNDLLIIQPNHYLALTTNKEKTALHYPSAALDRIHIVPILPPYPNQQGNVTIFTDQALLIDSLYYNAEMHHALFTNAKGISLERQHFAHPTQEHKNWQSSSSIGEGATPGYRNTTHYDEIFEKKIFFLSSKTVSPNHDSFEDELIINYNNKSPNFLINIDIYNENGKIVKRLIRNKNAGSAFQIKWDCRNETNNIVSPGHYIVLAEIYNDVGDRKRFKEAFVIVPDKLNY